MKEYGIDLSRTRPRILTDEIARHARIVVTMGCATSCPKVERAKMEDWALPDPAGMPVDEVRKIRDDILRRVQAMIEREKWGKPAPAGAAAGGAKPAAGTSGSAKG
jgi:arsenate reductase